MSEYLITAIHLELADQGAGGEFVKLFPATNPMANFNFSGSDLESALQAASRCRQITGSNLNSVLAV